jgi:hypothetical protein
MEMNTEADSIEALRRKMLIAGTSGLHGRMTESEPVDTPLQQTGADAKTPSAQAQDDQDEEKTIQS